MNSQAGHPEHPDSPDLADLKKWAYTFTWLLPFHYVQDRVQGLVEFNMAPDARTSAVAGSFPALAQFVTVYPQVRADLESFLARIDATTDSMEILHIAAIAVESLIDLLARLTTAAAGPDGLAVAPPSAGPVGQADLSYAFEIIEGAVELPDPVGQGATITALLVTISGVPATGMGTPVVLVDPGRYAPVPRTPARGRVQLLLRRPGDGGIPVPGRRPEDRGPHRRAARPGHPAATGRVGRRVGDAQQANPA
jgi:hypothetical protein